MEISWDDRVKNEVFRGVNEEWNILNTIKGRNDRLVTS